MNIGNITSNNFNLDGNGKDMQIEVYEQLIEQLLVAQTNEETFRLEMKDITQTLGLDENTLFDDVKAYVRSLKDNWNKLKEYIYNQIPTDKTVLTKHIKIFEVLDKMQELERSVSDDNN
jgi:hypothetical protein